MYSPLVSWAKLVPLHPSSRSQLVLGFPPADRKNLWELDMHAWWTKTQLLALTISFDRPGIWSWGPCL